MGDFKDLVGARVVSVADEPLGIVRIDFEGQNGKRFSLRFSGSGVSWQQG